MHLQFLLYQSTTVLHYSLFAPGPLACLGLVKIKTLGGFRIVYKINKK